MSYTPNEWDSGDVVTAVKMNALETAVGDMNMSYTPNTWTDGDILTASKMNALEQAVASGGGGGSSDFSTATVSVDETGENQPILNLCAVFEEGGNASLEAFCGQGFNDTFTVPLYKGHCGWYLLFTEDFPTATIVVTGDIVYEDGAFFITGNGTITIS